MVKLSVVCLIVTSLAGLVAAGPAAAASKPEADKSGPAPSAHTRTASASQQSNPPPSALSFRLSPDGLAVEGRWKSRPVLADLNGDGNLDLAAHPRLARGAAVWLGDGEGAWSAASDGLAMFDTSCGGGLLARDVNDDDAPDLVVADHCHGIYVYLGDGEGAWQATTLKLAPAIAMTPDVLIAGTNPFRGAEGVAAGDVNGDGHPDLVGTASDQGGFAVYLGDGSGTHWEETADHGLPRGAEISKAADSQRGGWANDILLTDMDGDGHLDLVASYYLGPRVWRGDGEGRFQEWSEGLPRIREGGLFRRVAVGDVDHDGLPDLVATRMHGNLAVYRQRRDGGFEDIAPALHEVSIGSEAVATGDLDGDGLKEVLVGTRLPDRNGYGIRVLRVAAGEAPSAGLTDASTVEADADLAPAVVLARRWELVPVDGLPAAGLQIVWGIALGDVNGDGSQDLAVTLGGDTFAPSAAAAIDPPVPHVQVWLNASDQLRELAGPQAAKTAGLADSESAHRPGGPYR